jgi:hypothetical protein
MNHKSFIFVIFFTLVCLSLNTVEAASRVNYGNALLEGKAYIFERSDSSCIYIAEGAKIYDEDFQLTKETIIVKTAKKTAKLKKETPEPPENDNAKQKSIYGIFPDFPFSPSASASLQAGREEAAISPQQRHDKQQFAAKTRREYIYPEIAGKNIFFYFPKQRQKLSPSAIQCGVLTSFESHSPPRA